MKKLSVVFAMLLMLVLCISVGASELDVLKEPVLNATYTTSLKTEFSNADEFIAALEEISGEELDIDGQGMVDAYTFLDSLFDILGESTMKVDISEDYNKIKLSTENAVDLEADVNKNLYVFAHATTSVWIDMDISDITNPKCLVIISEPNNKKYQYVDLFETMDDETKLQTILVLKAILNEQVIGGINDSIIAMYEDNAEITSDKDTVTVRFDNEGFVNTPFCQITHQSRVVKIQLWSFYKALKQIVGIRMEIKNNTQCFQNSQPILCLCLIDIRISCDFCHINHLTASCCHRSNKSKKFKRINGIRQFFNITFNISRQITAVKNLAIAVHATYNRRHGTFINAFENTSCINFRSACLSCS